MGGLIKGALWGLACAIALIMVAVVLAPDVDPAQDSETPVVGQELAPDVGAPDVPTDVDTAKAESAVPTPNAPKTPAVVDASTDPDVATTTPAIVVDPALPKTVQTPDVDAQANVEAVDDPAVDVTAGATGLPAAQSEAQSDVLTQDPDPIEAKETPPAPPVSDTPAQPETSIAPIPNDTPIQPESQPNPNRAQSNAESEDGPPSVQFESPEPPRAIARPVESEGFGKRVGTFVDQENNLVNRAPTVRVNRLPNVSQGQDETRAEASIQSAAPNALRDNRAPFEATGKPLISILLLEGDDRSEDADRLALITDFGVPLSIAIDPTSEGAAQRAAEYYAVGADIVVLSELPHGASPQDVEVILAQYQNSLPMAVAMMEKPAVRGKVSATQRDRTLLQHVVVILRDRGYGLVAENKGLNTAVQLANKMGVPHTQIFYRITPAETQDQLRTIFNRAVFRATQKGAAVLTAPGDVTALTALKAWALVDRPASVQIAPVSAVMLGVAPQ